MSDNVELSGEWTKQYSKSRQRDYYFNARTGESLWTLDEVKERLSAQTSGAGATKKPIKDKKESKSTQQVDATVDKQQPSSSSKLSKYAKPKSSKGKTPNETETSSQHVVQKVEAAAAAEEEEAVFHPMIVDSDEVDFDDPMDIEICENICRIRYESDTTSSASELISSSSGRKALAEANAVDDGERGVELRLILVIDTNIFLAHLGELDELLARHANRLLLSVPWTVLQELDYIKSSSSSGSSETGKFALGKRARHAIGYISDVLDSAAKSRHFIFEDSFQSQESCEQIKCQSNDDRIIKCAIRLSREFPSLRIILITNDKNLANKSIICRTQAMHLNTLKANIISLLLQATSAAAVSTARCDLPAENVSRTTITPTKTTETATAAANMDIVLPAFQDARIALLMHKLSLVVEDQLMSCVLRSLSCLYEAEMKRAYHEIWIDMLILKPPWHSLSSLLVNFDKSFSALFGFEKSSKAITPKFATFRDALSSYEDMRDSFTVACTTSAHQTIEQQLTECVRMSTELLSFFQLFDANKKEYGKEFSDACHQIDAYVTNGIQMFNLMRLVRYLGALAAKEITGGVDITSNDFSLFAPIWAKFSELVNNLVALAQQTPHQCEQHNKLQFQYLVSNESIELFHTLFEKCMTDECNAGEIACMTLVMFVLIKLLDIDSLDADVSHQMNEQSAECQKYAYIKSFLTVCFSQADRQLLFTGLKELHEFKKSFHLFSLSSSTHKHLKTF